MRPPERKLFGPDGVCGVERSTTKLPPSQAAVTYITDPTIDPKLYPPSGQKFYADYKAKYGKDPEPYSIYGYEAMGVVLDAIKRAGADGGNRQEVIDSFFATKDRDSVFGKYSINEYGDTTLEKYGAKTVKDKKLVFNKVIEPSEPIGD